ncbi:MAG: hypothetical protein JWO38_5002 [Gemmataceae bacterium]|nr:hypothetical protein [Gemmataceae bacterium]
MLLAAPVAARADDAADARALVDKAVKAHGGAELAKFSAYTVRMKGTVKPFDKVIAFTGVVASHGPDRQKVDIEVEDGGLKFRFVIVLNGDKGWHRSGDETKAMDKDELAEAKELAHAGWVTTLVPLKDKTFTLATVGEIKVDGRAAVGVKVSSKGRRDVDLYFVKETGLLVKIESRVKDEGSGQEVTEETYPGEYKEVQGTKQPMKITRKRDGKAYIEGKVTGYDLAEKLDADVFAKP